jgi:hypothetical protein
MAIDTLQRPTFVEGQYIGAEDLESIVAYHRARAAEHVLSAHSWGIVSGLELIERPSPGGGVEVWLSPGLATDGYGRPLILRNGTQLGIDQLRGRPSGNYRVWLNHKETARDAIRPGWGVCNCDGEAFSRAAEGYEVLLTGDLRLDERQSGIQYAGVLRADARLALRALDPDGPFVCDAAVAEQAPHPRGARARWLVPVGLVTWDETQNRLVARDQTTLKGSRLARRYAASIAESLYPASGVLRLRQRLAQPAPGTPDSAVDAVCAQAAMRESDLAIVDGRPSFAELVWIEGNLRLLGDQRIWGGRIEFRDGNGGDSGKPLYLRAMANPAAPAAGRDLAIALGAAGDGTSRLVAGPAAADGTVTGRFVVTSAGRVGIGTADPAPGLMLDVRGPVGVGGDARLRLLGSEIRDDGAGRLTLTSGGTVIATPDPSDRVVIGAADPAPGLKLDVKGDFGRSDGPSTVHLWASTLGDRGDGILRIRSGGSTVAFDGGDRVGIGTTAPLALLHVAGSAAKTGGGSWSVISDERLKKDVAPIDGALDRLLALRGVTFAWQEPQPGQPERDTGFLAGEVEKVFPDWVETGPDGYRMLGIRGFEALVVEALRTLRVENAALRERVEALERSGPAPSQKPAPKRQSRRP